MSESHRPFVPFWATKQYGGGLLQGIGEDPNFRSAEALDAMRGAIGELKHVTRRPAEPGAAGDRGDK